MALTKSKVDALTPKEKAYVVADGTVTGLSLRVATNGTKTWRVEYRPYPGGRGVHPKRITLGKTTIITPKQARERALQILADAKRGLDPAKELKAERHSRSQTDRTVNDLLDLYAQAGRRIDRGKRKGRELKPQTWSNKLRNIENHIRPVLGSVRLADLRASHVETLDRKVTDGTTACDEKTGPRGRRIVRGGAGAARKVVRDFSSVCSFGMRRGYLLVNPCETASVNTIDNERTTFLTVEQTHVFLRGIDEVERETGNAMAADICRLWLSTGCRRNEIAALRWNEVDFEERHLVLEDTKQGRSLRPMSESAAEILRRQRRHIGSPYVFPATRGDGHYQGHRKFLDRVRSATGLTWASPHVLRHTLGSLAISNGLSLPLTGALLGHRKASSTTRYANVAKSAAVASSNFVNDVLNQRKVEGD